MLRPDNIPAIGFNGMAKQRQFAALGPDWCVKATNCVVDGQSRMAVRNGWIQQNATPIASSPDIVQLHEYLNAAGTSEFISTTATKLWSGLATLTDKTAALAFTDGNWKLVNFNGYCLGWKTGETPIQYNGTGNFATIAVSDGGTLPDGSTVLAAFGRVWGLDDDKQTIRYSALLDHTAWAAGSGGGLIDMRQVWTKGMDQVMAILSYGSALVVFGKRHIVIWVDGAGSDIGIDPDNMYVTQVIENVGLVARDAVSLVGELDVVFWSSSGVRSLRRAMQEAAAPANQVSPSNNKLLTDALLIGDLTKTRMHYWASEGLVLLSHPDNDVTYVFDTKHPLEDGGFRMTTWTLIPTAIMASVNESLYFGFPGIIGKYAGFDDDGTAIRFEYESGWIPLVDDQDGKRRILKRLKAILYSPTVRTVVFKWWTDFKYNLSMEQRELPGGGDEYEVGEWGAMEWGAGVSFHDLKVPMRHDCEYLKLGVVAVCSTSGFGIQPMKVYSTGGRLA